MDMETLTNGLETITAFSVLATWIWSLRQQRKEDTAYYRSEIQDCMSDVKEAINKLEVRFTTHIDTSK